MDTFQPYHYYGHYYGNIIRKLYLTAAVLMLMAYSFFAPHIPVPYAFSITAVIVLLILAGWLNPLKEKVLVISLVVSIIAVIVFGYFSINNLHREGAFIIINQILAILFLISLYLNTKTFRAEFLGHKIEQEQLRQVDSKAEAVAIEIKTIEEKLRKNFQTEVERQDQALGNFMQTVFKTEDNQSQDLKHLAFRLEILENSLRQIQEDLTSLSPQNTGNTPSADEGD